MAEPGPTQQELDEAKSYLNGSQMLSLDTSAKLAQAMLQYQNDGLPIDYIDHRGDRDQRGDAGRRQARRQPAVIDGL